MTATLQHLPAIDRRRRRPGDQTALTGGWVTVGSCTCGWTGTGRAHAITAADDTAAHLLETAS